MLAARVDVDQEVIAQLVADGVLDRERAAHLEVALRVSQDTNRKVQAIAEDLVRTGDVSDLPGA